MKSVILYLWQFPQNILGLLLRAFYKGSDTDYKDVVVRRSSKMCGGISLGEYIIVSEWSGVCTIEHEYGHCKQSRMLGWLYLLVIGLPSIVWAFVNRFTRLDYYAFPTERWADRLGNVIRKK